MKLSLCTTCMGRLRHLQSTLPENLKVTKDVPDIEFVLVNYSSKDGLDSWIKGIVDPRLRYVKVEGKDFFCATHAKNVAARNSTGDVICNIDADNFVLKEYVIWLFEEFKKNVNIFTHSEYRHGSSGKIALSRDNFYKLGGYDERIKHYFAEELDLINRAKMMGITDISQPRILNRFIDHSPEECRKNFPPLVGNPKYIEDIYKGNDKNKTINPNGDVWGLL